MATRHLLRVAVPVAFLAACAPSPATTLSTSGGTNPSATSATSPSTSPSAGAPLQPLVVGWQQFFKLDWEVGQRNGRPVVVGRVYNSWGKPAANMRLLVQGLDGAGRVTEQQLTWLAPSSLPPGTYLQFETPALAPAATYRVTVFAFDWGERGRKF